MTEMLNSKIQRYKISPYKNKNKNIYQKNPKFTNIKKIKKTSTKNNKKYKFC